LPCGNKLSSVRLAIIAAVFTVIGDLIALMAALAAFNEEQQSQEKRKIIFPEK